MRGPMGTDLVRLGIAMTAAKRRLEGGRPLLSAPPAEEPRGDRARESCAPAGGGAAPR
jgi:hypothetical protein